MAFFEEIGKKIVQTSQGVVQKTKDTADVLKINSMISDEEKQIASTYQKLGEKYYSLHTQSCEPQLLEYIVAIKNAKARIAAYSEQVRKLKGVVQCPGCGADVQYGTAFCSSCGFKMPVTAEVPSTPQPAPQPVQPAPQPAQPAPQPVQPAPQPESKICPNCQTILDTDSLFCTNCGAKL